MKNFKEINRTFTVKKNSIFNAVCKTRYLALLVVLIFTCGNVWGADQTATWTATSGGLGSGIGSGTITDTKGYSWSYTRTLSSGSSYTGWSSNCIQLGKNGGVENLTLSTSKIPGTIKSVSVECASYQGKHNVSITVGTTTYLKSTATSSWTTVNAMSGTGTSSGTITISFTGGTRALYIKSISVTYNNDGGGCTAPTITAQPTGATYTQNDVATAMSITASGTSVTYQWYSNTSNSTSGASPISGATSSSYTPPTSTVGTKYYYCVASSSTCTTTSNIVSVVVNAPRYTVSFNTGTGNPTQADITEASAGAGITLPDGPTPACSSDGWVFAGWAESSCSETTTAPELLAAGDEITPESDMTLYAVYYKLTSGTSTATFAAANISNLTEHSYYSLDWRDNTGGVELYISDGQRYTGNPAAWNVTKSTASDDYFALIDAHRKISSISITVTDGTKYKFKSVVEDAGTASLSTSSNTQTVTCSGNVTKVYLYSGTSYQVRATSIAVTYYNAKYNSNPTCCTPPATALSITGANTVAMDATLSPGTNGGNGGTITWSVVNGTGSATINPSTGVLTPSSVGTVTIKAHQDANDKCAQDAEKEITITAATVNVTGVTVSPTTKAIVVGETFTITPTVSPNDATNKSVNWTSANGSIASVSSGTVTGVAAGGPVNITCTTVDGSFTASCATTVYSVTLVVKDEDGTTLSGDGKPTLTRSGASLTATEAGNYVFKDIQVTSGTGTLSSTSSTTPTITSVSSNITVTATFWKPITVTKGTGTGASTFTISATTVARGGSVTVTCAPDASHKNPWTLTITPNDGATYTASGSESSTTISNITKNITVDLAYAAKTPYSLTFSTKSGYGSPSGGKIDETNLSFNASGTVTTPLLEGQTLTFPSVSSFAADECSTTFEGWSTNPSCATAPTIKAGDELVLSGASGSTTYYAVYSQVEEGGGDDFDPSEDVDGDFYITEKNKGYYATNTIAENVISTVTNKDNANKYHIESVIVSGDRRFILSTLVNTTTKYLVMATTGSGQSKQNTLTTTETKNDATKFEITEGAVGTNGTWQVGYNKTRGLMYRTYTPSGQSTVYRFGNYAFSNASSTGYSLLEFEPAASKTYTTNPTCTETFTVTLTGGEGASVDVIGGNVKYNGGTAARFAENDAVSISATPTTGYSFSGWSITKEHGGSVTPASSAANTTFTMPADNVTVTATFSPILVSSLKLRAQQTGQSDKTGSDLTMNCYPKEGQTGGNDPLNHSLNVKFHEVLPADALDKTYTWSVRVKATGAADWTNVDFTGNVLNTNDIINSYNKNTGNLQIKATEGTAEIKITANDGSGVSAKVTITVAKVSVTSISVDPTSMNVYAGQKKPVTITFAPLNASNKAYKAGSYSYVTIRSSGSNPFYIEGNETEVVRNETVTVTSDDGSKTATVAVTVNPLPKATFVDIVQNKTDFVGVPSTGILSSTVDEGGLTVTTTKNTPTHADVAKPATGNNCEKEHLHLVGWILKDWADENPDATSAQIAAAGAGYFYAAGSEIDLVAKDGKTFYAVWAKEVTTP